MAHKDWCGKPCSECASPCRLDEETPCSSDCEALNGDGSRNTEVCLDSRCDAVEDNDGYMCCLHDTPRTFNWCEKNCNRYHSCDTVVWAGDELKKREQGLRVFTVTITETLKFTVEVEAVDQHEAEQIVNDNWKKSEYVLDADNFVGVKFEALPVDPE